VNIGLKIQEAIASIPQRALARGGGARNLRPPAPAGCLNCGQAISGKFCSNCGQEAVDHRAALWPLLRDVLDEFVRWDSKIVKTIALLLARPGFLTNEYNDGKRVKYLSPFRLYLTVSVLFFVVLLQHTSHLKTALPVAPIESQSSASLVGQGSLKEAKREMDADVPVKGDKSPAAGVAARTIATRSAPANEVVAYRKIPKLYPGSDAKIVINDDVVYISQLPTTLAEYQALQRDPKYPFKNRLLTQRLVARFYNTVSDPRVLFQAYEDLSDLLPKAMFLLLPVFAILMYPLYWRNGRYYVEHLTFALHNHTFAFIALTAMIFLPHSIAGWMLLVMGAYMFASMMVVYRQHWFVTLLKFAFVGITYTIVLAVGVVLTVLAALYYT
jgi:hypothetical protein